MSQLPNTSKYIVQFANDLWIVQDRASRMLIGVGERRDGLYHFRSLSKIEAMKVEEAATLELWLKRLGHPSENVIKLLLNVDFKNSMLDKHCDVHLKAKQTRDKFSLSDNKASSAFELIHCDL